jgi:hypothetical protein
MYRRRVRLKMRQGKGEERGKRRKNNDQEKNIT